MRSTARLIAPSTNTTGRAMRDSQSSGMATIDAMASALVSASRLGMSSPKMTEPAVIRVTAVPMPIGRAYCWTPGTSSASQPAMIAPMASPPNTPARMPIRVMPIWTVDSRLSGCSARCRATRAPRLSWAICLSLSLREVISAISDRAKKAFRMIRAMTISSSSTAALRHGRRGRRRGCVSRATVRGGGRVVFHRVHPRVPEECTKPGPEGRRGGFPGSGWGLAVARTVTKRS